MQDYQEKQSIVANYDFFSPRRFKTGKYVQACSEIQLKIFRGKTNIENDKYKTIQSIRTFYIRLRSKGGN